MWFHCHQGLKPTSQGHKIVAVHCVRFTSSTTHSARLRAGQAMERAALRSARACGIGSSSLCWRAWTPRCFSSRTRVTQGGHPILGLVFDFLAPTEINIKSNQSHWVIPILSGVWLGESTITMDDIYVLCMLFSTVMLTSFFHLFVIVYLTNKFFNWIKT